MGLVELLLIAVGLSMDAFAVSVCKGLAMRRVDMRYAVVMALFFGGFQAGMPVLGWLLGTQLIWLIEPIDHWVAFVLLAFVGGKMIQEALTGDDDAPTPEDHVRIDVKDLLILAVATSIDALAVGISFAALRVAIVLPALFIGVITFSLSLVGVWVGHAFGMRYEKPAEVVGGIVLILIGLKVLLEHLGVI